ncbi:unnamed protein product [Effrenium voratum]|uniref:Uncharacterized protein n=1 Tax=Effrenium voratum TaxID=2562239 RepID=A0AA36I4T0_9DINO|nr:unnamed protein product [Effrenium voratum]
MRLQQPRSLPRFTRKGFKVVPTGPELQEFLLEFYHKAKAARRQEEFNHWGQTQVNAHAAGHFFVSLLEPEHREAYHKVVAHMKPRLEKWVGVPLEFTSLYGMREYYGGAALRHHVDRPEVLIVSTTISVYQEGFDHKSWPVEVISYDGRTYRAERLG